MSFLQEEIKAIITKIRRGKFQLHDIKKYEKSITEKLIALNSSKNLRVYDKAEGGVLRGPKKSRRKYEDRGNGMLLCDPKYMTHGRGGTPSEVPYMRALFNARRLNGYDLVAYETPLMRKERKGNNDISDRAVSCDLLGINNNELCCIEVKTAPASNGTILPYAFLEGFAYAVCLDWIVKERKADLKQEIDLCCDDFRVGPPSIIPIKVTFAIAAPYENYFRPYIDKKIKGKNHSAEWFRRREKEVDVLEQSINKINPSIFAGYFVLSPSINNIDKKPSNKSIMPYFASTPVIKQKAHTFEQIT